MGPKYNTLMFFNRSRRWSTNSRHTPIFQYAHRAVCTAVNSNFFFFKVHLNLSFLSYYHVCFAATSFCLKFPPLIRILGVCCPLELQMVVDSAVEWWGRKSRSPLPLCHSRSPGNQTVCHYPSFRLRLPVLGISLVLQRLRVF